MLQKAPKLNAEAVTAEEIMEMLTLNGAAVLGLDDHTGSLEVGKQADIAVVDFNQPHLLPVGRWLPKLIYSANGGDVIHTIIDGKVLMKDRKVLTLDERQVLQEAVDARNDLVKIAGQETRDLLSAPWPKQGPYWRSIIKR